MKKPDDYTVEFVMKWNCNKMYNQILAVVDIKGKKFLVLDRNGNLVFNRKVLISYDLYSELVKLMQRKGHKIKELKPAL